jgi:phosphoribosylformimino-5-aminoimidazole carboxamide ribotide isomerase
MKVIPVLDIKKGVVVHAVKGKREQYQPVKSILTKSTNPLEVAQCLMEQTRCTQIYIADLDAIQGKGHNREALGEIARHLEVDLWVDGGIQRVESAKNLIKAGAGVVIIGSETLTDLKVLPPLFDAISPEKIVFSLDIKGGKVISPAKDLGGRTPKKGLEMLISCGINRFILLNLDVVGSGQGPDISLIKWAKDNFPNQTFIAGGGVKTPDHLQSLSLAGANGVLIATSLHNGWITRQDIVSPT